MFTSLRTSRTAVDNVSLNFYADQITSVLGPNGSGKAREEFIHK